MNNDWYAVLDAVEQQLAQTQAALTAGTPAPAPQSTVLPSEPLPIDLGDRARSLLALSQELEARAQERLAAPRGCAPRRTRPPSRGAPARTGTFVDVGA